MEVLFFLFIAFGSCRREGPRRQAAMPLLKAKKPNHQGKKRPPSIISLHFHTLLPFPTILLSGKQHTHTRRREEKEEVLIPPSSRSQGIWSGRRERRKTRKVQRTSYWSPCSPPPPYCLLFFSPFRIATKEKEEERSPPKEKEKKRRGDVETHCTKGKKEEGEKVSLHLLPYLRTFSLFKNYLFPQVEKEQQRSHKCTKRWKGKEDRGRMRRSDFYTIVSRILRPKMSIT